MFDHTSDSRYLLPSLLAADAADFGGSVRAVEEGGAHALHLDIMDGHFVPNLSYGPHICRCLSRITRLPLDVHLMVTNPERFVKPFLEAGATGITVHLESDCPDLPGLLATIREEGALVGLSIKPKTAVEAVLPYLPLVDMVLLMTVEPGYGGQAFIPESLERIAALRGLLDAHKPGCLIELDGGIGADNIVQCAVLGAEALVAGSACFGTTEEETVQKTQQLAALLRQA